MFCLTDLKQTHCAGNDVPKLEDIISSYEFTVSGKELERLKAHLSKIDTRVLAFACMRAAHTQHTDPPRRLALISIGGYNAVFRVELSSSETVIVRVPLTLTPSTSIVASSVATMTFARFVQDIPCPAVLAWNDSVDNPVGLPYVIMENCEGTRLDTLWASIDSRHQLQILWRLASYLVQLTEGQPFQKYGRLFFDSSRLEKSLMDVESYTVGDYSSSTPRRTDATFIDFVVHGSTSLQDMWEEAYTAKLNAMKERWEPSTAAQDEIQDSDWTINVQLRASDISTWSEAMSVANDLRRIIKRFDIPPALRQACLVPRDFAFRNVMYNPRTEKITGFLDWDEAVILPAVLIPHCPEDLVSNENPTMMDERALTVTSKLLGDWASLKGKPRGYYKALKKDDRLTQFHFHLSELEPFAFGTKENRFQQIFVEFLRLWDFPQYHISCEDVNLEAPSPCCVDAQKIHGLVQGSYSSWGRNRRWISDKAEELQKPV